MFSTSDSHQEYSNQHDIREAISVKSDVKPTIMLYLSKIMFILFPVMEKRVFDCAVITEKTSRPRLASFKNNAAQTDIHDRMDRSHTEHNILHLAVLRHILATRIPG